MSCAFAMMSESATCYYQTIDELGDKCFCDDLCCVSAASVLNAAWH